MGEAKHKRSQRERFFKQHPWCCFCGGTAPAVTVDHIPSRQMFSLRRRPKGLEVPACEVCNQATRSYEQAAAMLGRVYPDGPTEAERDEVRRIMRAVSNNTPGLLQEMLPSAEQQARLKRAGVRFPDVGGALNCSGPLLNRSIQIFGAKFGFALHYAVTGRIIPSEGGVAVQWYSNFDAVTGGIPPELYEVLGEPHTLRQGVWGVEEQFAYAFAITEDTKMGAYFSTFRKSFAVLSWVSDDDARFRDVAGIQVFRPGAFWS